MGKSKVSVPKHEQGKTLFNNKPNDSFVLPQLSEKERSFKKESQYLKNIQNTSNRMQSPLNQKQDTSIMRMRSD